MIVNEQVKRLAAILEKRIPLLTQYSPDGWQDFRDGVPATLRCGLFVNAYDQNPDALPGTFGASKPPESINGIRFKTSVSGMITARSIRRQLDDLIPQECFTDAPEVFQKGVTGELFVVKFEIDKTTLEELIAILEPAPARPFPTVQQLRLDDKELHELEDSIKVARANNTSFASVPCGSLGVLIREVRERRLAEQDGARKGWADALGCVPKEGPK